MSYELTLSFTDPEGRRRAETVRSARYTIGRAEGNDLRINLQNLSRQHAVIESSPGGPPRLSDCGSRNGTRVNGRHIAAPVELRDGDRIALSHDCELTVGLRPASAAHAFNNQPPAHAQATPSPRAPHAKSGALPPWFSRYALVVAVPCAVLLLTLLLLLLLTRGPGLRQADDEPSRDPEASSVAERTDLEVEDDTSASLDVPDAPSSGDTRTAAPPDDSSVSSNDAPTNNSVTSSGDTPSSPASSGGALSEEQLTQAVRRVMSSMSTDGAPYIPAEGARDVAAKVRAYAASPAQTAARLSAARRSCPEVNALALSNNLKPSLVMYAALAASEGGADPAATARQMMPKLLSLRAAFGTDTANSALLLVAAYPYDYDPPVGTQKRMAHPLYAQLIASGGRTSKVDPALARTVWFLRSEGKIRPDAYDLVLRTLALGVISQNPRRYGVNAEPPLC